MAEQIKPWNGGGCPEDPDTPIKPFYRGPPKPIGIRITCAPANRLDWSHDGGDDDITGYVVMNHLRHHQ